MSEICLPHQLPAHAIDAFGFIPRTDLMMQSATSLLSESVKVKCAIAFDIGSEIEEIVRKMLPAEWRPHISVAALPN